MLLIHEINEMYIRIKIAFGLTKQICFTQASLQKQKLYQFGEENIKLFEGRKYNGVLLY